MSYYKTYIREVFCFFVLMARTWTEKDVCISVTIFAHIFDKLIENDVQQFNWHFIDFRIFQISQTFWAF